ncbi:cytochrome c oxidase subunit II [Candidatus Nitrosacidococcus tergens]|uniref:Cytochrome c oxidase subunit 2 n=1 Tax=Candidatus Nitrosacidococcus tergens TaxID=553981 RepID=A0A7G1QC82_9GAMM|nr:cytochrome c oxidase subunit II [Candidatus Nitrosacidococcus tergens]CAB1277546.1 Cytochrome c oxidase subunit II [Candidatus Nitrosacidococcus tergens]
MSLSNKRKSLFATIAGSISLLLLSGRASAEFGFNLTEGVTPISKEIYGLHMYIGWVCVAIACLVYGLMAWIVVFHRRSKRPVASQFHEHALLEVVWTVIPFVILISIAIPATKAMFRTYDTSDPDLTVKVTGYQWRWKYDYIDHNFGFISSLSTPIDQLQNKTTKGENYLLEVDHPLVLPINKKVRFVITADDVIHAWWLPAFGFKQDAIPGYINDAWAVIEKPGTYRGQCTEICGRGHAFMPIVVEAKTQEEFDRWVTDQVALLGNPQESKVIAQSEQAK